MLPSAVKSVPYSRVKDIQFSKTPTSKPSPAVKDKSIPAQLETELINFLSSIKNCSSKPALLSLIPEHSDSYVPKSLDPELPIVLSNLFDKHLADADFPCLLEKAEEVVESLVVDKNQQALVEGKTRDQANSRLWFRMRTGRITASKFKAAVVLIQPALHSLSSWAFVIHKWPASTPRQPSGAVSMKGQQGSPTATIRRTDML